MTTLRALSTHLDNSSFMGANDILGRVPLLASETVWPLLAYSSDVLINLEVNLYQTSLHLPPSHYVFPEKLSERTLLGAESLRLLVAINSEVLALKISIGVPLLDI